MERLVLWYRGDGEKTPADVVLMLPTGAHLLDSAPASLFLVEAERSSLEDAFTRADGWTVASDKLVGTGIRLGS